MNEFDFDDLFARQLPDYSDRDWSKVEDRLERDALQRRLRLLLWLLPLIGSLFLGVSGGMYYQLHQTRQQLKQLQQERMKGAGNALAQTDTVYRRVVLYDTIYGTLAFTTRPAPTDGPGFDRPDLDNPDQPSLKVNPTFRASGRPAGSGRWPGQGTPNADLAQNGPFPTSGSPALEPERAADPAPDSPTVAVPAAPDPADSAQGTPSDARVAPPEPATEERRYGAEMKPAHPARPAKAAASATIEPAGQPTPFRGWNLGLLLDRGIPVGHRLEQAQSSGFGLRAEWARHSRWSLLATVLYQNARYNFRPDEDHRHRTNLFPNQPNWTTAINRVEMNSRNTLLATLGGRYYPWNGSWQPFLSAEAGIQKGLSYALEYYQDRDPSETTVRGSQYPGLTAAYQLGAGIRRPITSQFQFQLEGYYQAAYQPYHLTFPTVGARIALFYHL